MFTLPSLLLQLTPVAAQFGPLWNATKRDFFFPGSQRNHSHYHPHCVSFLDPLVNLYAEEQRWVSLLTVAGGLLTIAAMVLTSLFLGNLMKPRPPKYWKHRANRHIFNDNFDSEVDVTTTVGPMIQKLIDTTTTNGVRLRVIRVTCIEHGKMWTQYKQLRRSMPSVEWLLNKMAPEWRAKAEQTLRVVEAAHSERETEPTVKQFMKMLNLDKTRNERMLFKGVPGPGAMDAKGRVLFETEAQSPMYAVKRQGFSNCMGNVNDEYGCGITFHDSASLADENAGLCEPSGEVGEQAAMFLSRVVLGPPYFTSQSLEQLQRPPCIHGHFDLKLSWNRDVALGKPWSEKGVDFQICEHPRFDSVLAEKTDGDTKIRNYVVYADSCYPEFCILYERVRGS